MRSSYQCWSQMAGPMKIVDDICQTLAGKKPVWIGGEVGWPEDFRETVKDELGMIETDINIEFVDANELDGQGGVADLVFQYDDTARRKYLPAMDLVNFIQKNRVLPTTIIWLYNVDPDRDKQWLDFSGSLAKQGCELKVICEGRGLSTASRNVVLLSQAQYLTPFDYLLFAMMLVQEEKWNIDMKVYACRLTVALAGQEAEVISELLEQRESLIATPQECVRQIMPGLSQEETDHALRTTQLTCLLPKIELLLAHFIENAQGRLSTLLPFVDDYGLHIDKLEDVELRHIVFLENTGQIRLTTDEYSQVRFLYNMRNKLAHRMIVEGNDVIACLSQ